MKRAIIIWSIIVAVIVFFFFGISLPFRNEYVVSLAIVGGFICCGLVVYFFVTSEKELPVGLFLISVLLSIFLFGGMLIYKTTKEVQYEYENNYVLVDGRIKLSEGSYAIEDERTKAYIPYDVPGSHTHYLMVYVKWRAFDLRSFNYNMPIIYSKKYPALARMVLGEEDRKKYGVYYADTLNKKQQYMLKNIEWKINFGTSYNMATARYNGLTDAEKEVVLHHIEPLISEDSGSMSWLPAFASIMSVVFLAIKLLSK